MADELSWDGVLAWRVERQGIAERVPAAGWVDVVRRICGLHAQVQSSAELTLWARVDDLGRDTVSHALWDDRALVKTWAMRGTLHLLASDELGLWVGAQGALKPRYETASWRKAFGMSSAEAVRGSFGTMPKLAALRGDACFAPPAGQRVRFTRPDLWLGPWEPVAPPRAALTGVLRRYLAVYGPATREDFARWFGIRSAAEAGRALKGLGEEVLPVTIAGDDAGWMLRVDVAVAAAARPRGTVALLPAFDQYVVAAPRGDSPVLAAEHKARVYRPQGWLSPVLLADGRIEGVWRHERKGRRLALQIEPFGDPGEAVRAGAAAEAARLAAYLGAEELDVSWA